MALLPKVVLFMEDSRGAARQCLQGIADYARLNGPWTFKVTPPSYFQDSASKATRLEAVRRWGVNGIMTLDLEDIPALQTLGVPMIVSSVISTKRFNLPYVDSDNSAIGKMAADYFIKKGFRNFAFCGLGLFPWSIERGKAFEKNIKKAGFKMQFYDKLLDTKMSFWDDKYSELENWLKSLPKPVAVLACNDDRGRQILDECRTADIKVPEQVAVLGIDNDTIVCGLSFCQLSSMELGFTRAGYEAAELLDGLMRGKRIKQHRITIRPTSIVTRQSTDIFAIADPDVAMAVHYITANIKTDIQVNDVCEHMHISQRVLYQKFMDGLGCTAYDAITRIRVEEISKVILGTNLPIAKIAVMFNFSSPKHISRYFSKQMGLSPIEYRKLNQHKLPTF